MGGERIGERIAVPAPWWQDVVRFWVPVLGIGGVIVFQMVALQRQIGDLRAEVTAQMGTLRADLQGEMGTLRADLHGEMGALRADLQGEMGALRADLGERITRLETLMETHLEFHRENPADGFGRREGRFDHAAAANRSRVHIPEDARRSPRRR